MYDIIILGSGPAGLTAALYSARGGKKTLVLGGNKLGGQTASIPVLENYPGWQGSGPDLINFMKGQVESFGATVIMESADIVTKDEDDVFRVTTESGTEYKGTSVIAATGASPRRLEIAGAKELLGKGVSYCAMCDGFFYSGKEVLVIGGGNSALNDALYLGDLADKVKIIYRRDTFTCSEQVLIDRVKKHPNMELIFNTELRDVAARGADKLVATTTTGEEIICDGIFIAIGHEANTEYLDGNVKRDTKGRLIQSELPMGMFTAGDVKSGIKMQIATAVGSGCEAAMDALVYVNSRAQ